MWVWILAIATKNSKSGATIAQMIITIESFRAFERSEWEAETNLRQQRRTDRDSASAKGKKRNSSRAERRQNA